LHVCGLSREAEIRNFLPFASICPNRQSNFASLIASIMPTTISNENKYIYCFLLCLPRRQRIDLIQYRRFIYSDEGRVCRGLYQLRTVFFPVKMPSISQAFLSQELMFLAYNLKRAERRFVSSFDDSGAWFYE